MENPRLPHSAGSAVFAIVWEYQVRPEGLLEFERIYRPGGDWAQFFAQGNGYLGTALLADPERSGRYFTLDYWVSQDAFERFREQNNARYEAIDRRCAALTEREARLGSFLCYGPLEVRQR